MTPRDVLTMLVGLPITIMGVGGAILYGAAAVIRLIQVAA